MSFFDTSYWITMGNLREGEIERVREREGEK